MGEIMKFDWMDIKEPLLNWYKKNHRDLLWRKTENPYNIWISEIMLQQTRVEAVKEYYNRFLTEIPDIKTLSIVSEEKLLKLWEGLGYYNRARNLQKAARIIMEQYDGKFPMDYDEVIKLPGIGEYTAGAICSISYNLPTPAVDGNVLRVLMRISNCNENIDLLRTKHMVKENLQPLYEDGKCGELTQSLMEIGATVCIPNGIPKCFDCPLCNQCKGYKEETYHLLPIRNVKKKRKIEEKTVFILHDGLQYGIKKRGQNGLLANLWEFYNVNGKMNAQEAVDFISKQGYEPVMLEKEVPYKHIFSHVEWRMTAYYIECRNHKNDLVWIDKQDFKTQYALPTAFKVFLERES